MSLVPALRGSAASLLLLAGAVAGCTPELPPARPDGGLAFLPERHTDFITGVGVERPDGGVATVLEPPRAPEADAGPARPPAALLPLLSVESVLPDGSSHSLARDGVTAVEPSARFRVEIAARLTEARLTLLDAQDAMVAAGATTEAAETTRFTLTPAAPLRPGTSYTLRLDGADERLVRAEDGRSFEPVSLALKVAGNPPAAPPRKARRKRSR